MSRTWSSPQLTDSVNFSAQSPFTSQSVMALHDESHPTVFGGSHCSLFAASVYPSPQKLGRHEALMQIFPVPHAVPSALLVPALHW